ncbi:MAG: sugar ABC transporter ATP-binding protein [Rhodospirillaceae bacterium]|nr:sugar ABC transporter ATP-binding protein [Rhodospirillaceae bacterium]
MSNIKLEIINLRKEYGDLVAVDDLSLSVEQGETMALLGPSGCGKSTTLNMIVGLEQPTSGDILIDGKSVINTPSGKRNVGLVFQDYAVFTNMTVEKNLAYGLRVRKEPKDKIASEVLRVADFMCLSDKIDRKPSELSASELQRVAIGRTLVTNPDILLLDEPLSNLEADDRNRMRRELRSIQAETGQTVIYVTHDQIEALSLAHRIAVMNFGHLMQYDTAENVYQHPQNKFVGSFLGNPPMNFVKGVLRKEGDRIFIQNGDSSLPVPTDIGSKIENNSGLIAGFRPETLTVTSNEEDFSFSAEVLAVEPQGPESVVTAKFGDTQVKVVVPSESESATDGNKLNLMPNFDLLALFDPDSGMRLMKHGG